MLYLTRKIGQDIVLILPPSSEETRVVVRVQELRPGRATLGFTAPDSVDVLRRELLHRKGKDDELDPLVS